MRPVRQAQGVRPGAAGRGGRGRPGRARRPPGLGARHLHPAEAAARAGHPRHRAAARPAGRRARAGRAGLPGGGDRHQVGDQARRRRPAGRARRGRGGRRARPPCARRPCWPRPGPARWTARWAARRPSGASSGGAVHAIVIAGPGRVILAGAPWRAAVAGRRGRDRAGRPGHRLARPALARHGRAVRAAGAASARAASARGRLRDHVGVAEPRCRPHGR